MTVTLIDADVTVIGKDWDPRGLRVMTVYRCGACRGTFRRGSRDGFPRRCPRCGAPVRYVLGGMKAGDR